jgi:hypothetical protein
MRRLLLTYKVTLSNAVPGKSSGAGNPKVRYRSKFRRAGHEARRPLMTRSGDVAAVGV